MKIALVFPGQGSQYVGMCKDVYENYDVAKTIVDKANDSLGIDIKSIMFDGPEDELVKTENTQPAILTHSIALLSVLKEKLGLKYDACAGLSLGEYSALVAADVLSFEDAVKLVKKRGRYMQEAVSQGEGAMAAILGMERESVLKCLKDASDVGIVEIANYNSPGQIVISGEFNAVKKACELCKLNKAKRAVMLNVSGPFHSSMLKDASTNLAGELENVTFKPQSAKVVANTSAQYIKDAKIKEALIKQVSSSVLWEDSIKTLLDDGYDTFVEIGPGKTLKAFIKKIASSSDKQVNIYNVDNAQSIEEFLKEYKEA